MTGGDLKIEVLPAGAVVPAFGLLDAVSKGTLDGGHGVLVYHYGKQTALGALGVGSRLTAMDANMLLAWHKYGGGKELLDQALCIDRRERRVVPVRTDADAAARLVQEADHQGRRLQGLKFRTVGISIDVFTGMGAAVNALPGGEIVSAMDRGLLDAAEFNNATSDRMLGFADVSKVCMLQSYHQNAEQFEITFNKTKYDALPDKMKAIIANAVEAASQDMSWKAIDRYSQGLHRAADQGQRQVLQDAGLRSCKKQLEIYDEVVKKKAAENPLFKEIVESQLAFAKRATQWEQDTVVSRKMAFDHYLGRPQKLQEAENPDGALATGKAPSGARPDGALHCPSALHAERPQRMTVQRFLHTIDGISTWVGKAAAWLIIVLDDRRLRRGLQALHHEHADGVDLRRSTTCCTAPLFMLVRSVHAGAERPRPRRFPLQLDAAAHAGCAGPRCFTSSFSFPASPRSYTRDTDYAGDSWRIAEHSNVTAEGPPVYHFKTVHPARRSPGDAARHCRDRALRRLPQDRRMAEPAQGRRRDRRRRGAARAQRVRR